MAEAIAEGILVEVSGIDGARRQFNTHSAFR